MKHLIVLFLFVGLWNASISQTPKEIRLNRDFPIHRLDELKSITHDTLIFFGFDTVYTARWEWGIFYPHRFAAPYVQDLYYDVTVIHDLVLVRDELVSGDMYQIGLYEPHPLLFRWTLFAFLLGIHFFVWFVLRKLLIWIHRDDSYYTKRNERRNRILAILCAVIITSVFGWFTHAYFFLFIPICYLILLFLSPRRWQSRLNNMEMPRR